MKKRVAVIDEENPGNPSVVQLFHTISEAESFIAAQSDKAKVERGGFGIDAPENMINPPALKRLK